MTHPPNTVDVDRFRAILADRLGWTFDDDDVGQLARALARRAEQLRVGHSVYLGRLQADPDRTETAVLAEELTITETYFFRYAEQFDALSETVLPRLLADRAEQRQLRLLSVGCSSGEEAYTMAIVALRAQPDPAWNITVLGLDANPAVLRRATIGRYSAWSLRDTPDDVRDQWLERRDNGFEVVPRLRTVVRFRQHNVVDDDIVWHSGGYDVVFCRNLLMYLTQAARGQLIRRMTRSLTPGGYLFLGHTDSLGSNPEGLEGQHTHRTFYYRRPVTPTVVGPAPGRTEPGRPNAASPGSGNPASGRASAPLPADASSGRAGGDRPLPRTPGQQAGTAGPDPSRPAAGSVPGSIDPAVRARALSLLRSELFAPALLLVEAAMPERPDPTDRLLYGVMLAQAGRLDAAEIVARQTLDADGLYADAHHLLAVCLEDGAAAEVAIGHYRLAAHLDPRFAMPQLRLGLLARRRGDQRAAGNALESALSLLRHETDERITLFGGGFGRSSLLNLCRAELGACGVTR